MARRKKEALEPEEFKIAVNAALGEEAVQKVIVQFGEATVYLNGFKWLGSAAEHFKVLDVAVFLERVRVYQTPKPTEEELMALLAPADWEACSNEARWRRAISIALHSQYQPLPPPGEDAYIESYFYEGSQGSQWSSHPMDAGVSARMVYQLVINGQRYGGNERREFYPEELLARCLVRWRHTLPIRPRPTE
jgi:hypothetical protein